VLISRIQSVDAPGTNPYMFGVVVTGSHPHLAQQLCAQHHRTYLLVHFQLQPISCVQPAAHAAPDVYPQGAGQLTSQLLPRPLPKASMRNPTHPPVQQHTNPTGLCQQLPKAAPEPADPDAEHQFQQSYATTRRFWDAAAAVVTLATLAFLINLPALKARLCACPASTVTTGANAQDPARQLHPLLRTFPCGTAGPESSSTRVAQAAWLLRHWVPATSALYWISGDLEGSFASVCCIAALVCLFQTRSAAVTAEGYSRNRTLLMSIWRVGSCLLGLLVLVAYKLQRLPGWPAYMLEMYWGRTTMFGAMRLLWHAHLMAVSALNCV
jgi:hypothetical protein